jgi:hypothetical protein
MRMLEGKVEFVGVAGRSLTDVWGDLGLEAVAETVGEAMEAEAEEVEDAFECVWWWCGMERMEETDEEVDLRPRRPPELRLYEERGVKGEGETEGRLPDPVVEILGRCGACEGGCALARAVMPEI